MPEVTNTKENIILKEEADTDEANVLIYPAVHSDTEQTTPDNNKENAKEAAVKQPESSHTQPQDEASSSNDADDEDIFDDEEEINKKDRFFHNFFHFHSHKKAEMSRDELILSRISDEDLMEYLRLEQQRLELLQHSREVREKRIWTAFQLSVFLLAIVLIIYFLKDNPTILVSMLYTVGILIAFYIWNKQKDKDQDKKTK